MKKPWTGFVVIAWLWAKPTLAMDFKVVFEDAAGVGFNSTEPFAGHGANRASTLGEARRNVLFRAIDMVRSQVHGDGTIVWRVRFNERAGYLAVTLGPAFQEFTSALSPEQNVAKFPFEHGRHYPGPLMLALTSLDSSYADDSGEDATTNFSAYGAYYGYDTNAPTHSFIAVVMHELVHVLGFTDIKCLGNCIPAPVSKPTHFSKYVFGEAKPVDGMSLAELNTLYLSRDKLWFTGSAHTQQAAKTLLSGGHTNGSLHLHAEAPYDGQNGSHFAPQMFPAQLMYSAGANTTDFGMAAYVLCDIGWCAGKGEVQDLVVSVATNPMLSNEPSLLSATLENASDYAMTKPELLLQLPASVQLSGLAQGCALEAMSASQQQLRCQLDSLGARQKHRFDATLRAAKGSYALYGRASIKSYAVDPIGMNNIVDVTLSVTDPVPLTVNLGADVEAVAGTDVRLTAQLAGGSGSYQLQWQQTAGPTVSLTQQSNSISFVAPEVSSTTKLTFKVTASDGRQSQTAEVTVTVTPKAKPVEPQPTPPPTPTPPPAPTPQPSPPVQPASSGGAGHGMVWLLLLAVWRNRGRWR